MSPRRSSGRGRAARGKRRGVTRKGRPSRASFAGTAGLFAGTVLLAAIGVGVVHEEAPDESDAEVVQDLVWTGARVRVDVQNGGGVNGMARAATEILRPAGFDVVKIGNAPSYDLPSAVIDRVGRTDQAQAVAKALGIDNVLSEPNPNLYVDVTVVLGRAWTPDARNLGGEATGPVPWWDPRGWFGT